MNFGWNISFVTVPSATIDVIRTIQSTSTCPTIGYIGISEKKKKVISQPAGFEPARGNPIGFQVQRLNHSATTALLLSEDEIAILIRRETVPVLI